jgi:putative endonuclease
VFSRVYHVYIMASASRRLYIGVTGNLARRVHQHRTGQFEGFSKKYQMKRSVYVEATSEIQTAIQREKQIKGWLRARKIQLIEAFNPEWRDLGVDLLGRREILRFAQDDNPHRTALRTTKRTARSIASRMLDGSAFPVPAMSSAVP